MPDALLHRLPFAADHAERVDGVEALLAQQAANVGAVNQAASCIAI
jgi:hypothetical protein